jgi:LysM repeat protein
MDGSLRLLLAATLVAGMAGCAPGNEPLAASATASLLPVRTLGPVAPAGTSSPTIEPLATTGPSPTPLAYSVRPNDTFLGIALAFGVTREELAAANPGLNPDLLSIGQQILIPAPGAGGGTATPIPTPTPLPLQAGVPRCYLTTSGGAWCLLSVLNTTEAAVEALSGWVTMLEDRGAAVLTVPVYPPLNLVPAGKAMVLAAFVPAPAPDFASAVAALTMAVPVQDAERRYSPLEWSLRSSLAGPDRRSWTAEIEFGLPAETEGAPRVAFAMLAFGAHDDVVGFTKWEPDGQPVPGARTTVRLSVYSLGPEIERVEVLGEALAVP